MTKLVRKSAKNSPLKRSIRQPKLAGATSAVTIQGQPTSKQARVLEMLQSASGATIPGLVTETGW